MTKVLIFECTTKCSCSSDLTRLTRPQTSQSDSGLLVIAKKGQAQLTRCNIVFLTDEKPAFLKPSKPASVEAVGNEEKKVTRRRRRSPFPFEEEGEQNAISGADTEGANAAITFQGRVLLLQFVYR